MQEAASMPQLSGSLTIRRTCFLVPFLEGLFLLPEVKKKVHGQSNFEKI